MFIGSRIIRPFNEQFHYLLHISSKHTPGYSKFVSVHVVFINNKLLIKNIFYFYVFLNLICIFIFLMKYMYVQMRFSKNKEPNCTLKLCFFYKRIYFSQRTNSTCHEFT